MKNIIFITIALILFVFSSCTKESDLEESIHVSDSENPELPAYSEWGYNTFGTYIDRSVFTYSQMDIPLKITVDSDTVSFIFTGVYRGYIPMKLRFVFVDSNIDEYTDFLAYDKNVIDLGANGARVVMTNDSETEELDLISGKLFFKRAQRLYVDDVEEQIILSGVFDIKYFDAGEPITMHNGRFDIGVNDNIFYKF